jgi:hypothetical protein
MKIFTKLQTSKEIVQFETYTQDQIEVLDEISKQMDEEFEQQMDKEFEQEQIMSMYENDLRGE